jgi:phage terminase small subunit
MPARKPIGLITRNDTNDDRGARISAESALAPRRMVQKSEPEALKNHPAAAAEWRRLIRLYNSLDAVIISRLDTGMLLDYCMLLEQLSELDDLRSAAMKEWRSCQDIMDAYHKRVIDKPDVEVDLKIFTKAAEAVNWAFDKIVKIDGRVDRKRSLLLTLRQSLYLTPRSRAGVAPQEKPPEEPEDDMTKLLNSQE